VWRTLAGVAVLLHGLAHAWVGIWADIQGPAWIVTPAWSLAMVGFVMAGLALIRPPVARPWWPQVLAGATFASLALLIMFGRPTWVGGLVVDILILSALIRHVTAGAMSDMTQSR
jgi:hypothetical protein